jgi:glycosyltransferase involved in cell wall biosynthesis
VRIAQLAPLDEAVPPKRYGGTERVVSWLTEELVRRGHDVTLFASGDSHTTAELVPVVPRAERPGGDAGPLAARVLQLGMVARRARRFDVVHSHIDLFGFPGLDGLPALSTLHGRIDVGLYAPILRTFAHHPLVSISDAQRDPVPDAGWIGTVHHGLPIDDYPFTPDPEDYFAFVGRMSPEKRPDVAIEIARRAGVRLVLAAKVDRVDREYFETLVRPRLREPGIEYVGELGERDKVRLLRRARALLFPILWPEPFGLAMIEAMACGTPVLTRRCGSTPEVVADGATGFVCDSDAELVHAVAAVDRLDRRLCREHVARRFDVGRMARDYEALYARVAGRDARHVAERHAAGGPVAAPRDRVAAPRERLTLPHGRTNGGSSDRGRSDGEQ